MPRVGETLRRERLNRRLTLDQISHELRIAVRFLEAIEAEEFDKLPGAIFAKSFVRQYARVLELDADDLAAEVQRIIDPPAETEFPLAPPANIETQNREKAAGVLGFQGQWVTTAVIVSAAVLIVFAAYSLWQRYGRIAAVHEIASSAAPANSEPARVAALPREPAPQFNPAPAVDSADRSAPASFVQTTTQNSAPAPVQAANPAGAAVRVVVDAVEPVWVRASADGKFIFAGTLEPQQNRVIEGAGAVTLLLGNAGGASVSLNGKPIGPVGAKGQVRTVQLTSGGFTIGPPKAPADPLF
jgi:cytoskeletal protein RodZ